MVDPSPRGGRDLLNASGSRLPKGGEPTTPPPLCLVTAARLPVALRLVRLLRASGYAVLAADCLPFTACSAPGTADGYVRLPCLRDDPQRWIEALIVCCRERRVDFLLPVFEETYLVAETRERIEAACPGIRVFAPEASTLTRLRDKRLLAGLCREAGVSTPDWLEISAAGDSQPLGSSSWSHGCVLKPAMGYAGDGVILHPEPHQVQEAVAARPGCPWMLQQFIPGETICVHAIAHEGIIRALVLYRLQAAYGPGERGGVGFCCVFEPIEDPAVSQAAARIIAATRYTGHLGFDMIRNQEGVHCVDANPRATAGLNLLEFPPGLLEKFWDGSPVDASPASPCRDLSLMLSRALWSPAELWRTLKETSQYRDVALRREEPIANLLLLLVYGYFLLTSWVQREHPSMLITRDFAASQPPGS